MGHKSKNQCKKAKPLFSKKQMDALYKDDKYDKQAEQGVISPFEANLMRQGKYKKPR